MPSPNNPVKRQINRFFNQLAQNKLLKKINKVAPIKTTLKITRPNLNSVRKVLFAGNR